MTQLPIPTTDPSRQKADLDEFGYCFVESAMTGTQTEAVRTRLIEQLEAEMALGKSRILDDGKQLVRFLVNKGD